MKTIILLFALQFNFNFLYSQTLLKPFPQHVTYIKGIIKPDAPQDQLDKSVTSFYDKWKEHYIKEAGNGQCYVFSREGQFDKQCVSEGQGYGMIITALMAGHDLSAQRIYDALYYYFKAHPSKRSPYLMAWAQKKNFKDYNTSSATDGDMDIAYSLLLANVQWGSSGSINYLQEARQMMMAIADQEINTKTFSILKSNAVEFDSEDYYDMRPSDFMPAHLHAFEKFSTDNIWDKVIRSNYKLFDHLQKTYSLETGLFPDFIIHINDSVRPADESYEESLHDGDYDYNACRIPWRVGTDYILYGDERAKKLLDPINAWIMSATKGNPINISSGYTLKGKEYARQTDEKYFDAMCFMAPFAISAMTDLKNQSWLNSLWNYMLHFNIDAFDYYNNTIKMLTMIIISGNYWAP